MPKIICPKCGEAIEVSPHGLMGAIKTPRKSAASAANGKLGGRPKKKVEFAPE